MGILDRYLLAQFTRAFVMCWISLTGLYVVFDCFSNLDEFLRYGEQQGNLWGTLATFYGYRSVLFFDRTSAVLAMAAMMFTITALQRHHELVALMAAGVSRLRVAAPILLAAGSVSLVAAAGRELLIPRLSGELSQTAQDLVGDTAQEFQPRYDFTTNVLLGGQALVVRDRRIRRPKFVLPPGLNHHGSHLIAEDAFYEPAQSGRPSGYRLVKVEEPAALLAGPSLTMGGRTTIITPADAPDWLAADECFVASEVDFVQLRSGRAMRQFASTAALLEGLGNPSLDYGPDVRVLIHARIVQPLADVTLLFLGMPLVLGRDNRNVYLSIGLGLGVVVMFSLVALASQYLGGILWLDPPLAAWLPLFCFVPLAVALYRRVEQ